MPRDESSYKYSISMLCIYIPTFTLASTPSLFFFFYTMYCGMHKKMHVQMFSTSLNCDDVMSEKVTTEIKIVLQVYV